MKPVYPHAETAEAIRANLAAVRARIDAACRRCGRDPAEVRLLPVSKTVPAESLRAACDGGGIDLLGENRVQEAWQKWQALHDLPQLRWAIIGHLQTNKARYVARFAAEFQALDQLSVAEALDRRLQQEGRSLDVFIQINTSDEPHKYGIAPEEAERFLKALPAYSALKPRGLMTLALFSSDEAAVRKCFIRLRETRDRLQQQRPELAELSMGMSGDFELAIAEGATTVRVGQAIFGARNTPDSAYWPNLSQSPQ